MSSRTVNRRLRFTVLSRDEFTCQYCGRKPPEVRLEIDHIIPWSKGGKTEQGNLRTACEDCNSGKRDRTEGCGMLHPCELSEEYFAGLGEYEFIFCDPYITEMWGEPVV